MVSVTQVDQFTSILVIESLTPEHNGNYSCVVRNQAAEVSHTHQLVVNGKRACRVTLLVILFYLWCLFSLSLSQFLLLLSPFPSKTGCRKACEPEPFAAWAVGTNPWWSPGSRTGSPCHPRWVWTCPPLTPILASSAFLALIPVIRETSLVWRVIPLPRSGTPPSYRLKVTTQPVSFQNTHHPNPHYSPSLLLAHAPTGTPRSRYCCTLFCSFTRSLDLCFFFTVHAWYFLRERYSLSQLGRESSYCTASRGLLTGYFLKSTL